MDLHRCNADHPASRCRLVARAAIAGAHSAHAGAGESPRDAKVQPCDSTFFGLRDVVNDEAANREHLPATQTQLHERDSADMLRLASGHDEALNDLMERHGPKLFNYLIRCLPKQKMPPTLRRRRSSAFIRTVQEVQSHAKILALALRHSDESCEGPLSLPHPPSTSLVGRRE